MISLDERISTDNVRMTVKYMDTRKDDTGWMRHEYKVTLKRKGRQWTLPFYQGDGHTAEPETRDVLYCLLSDISGYMNSSGFPDWADEYGYEIQEPEIRSRVRKIYNDIAKQMTRAERFFGGYAGLLVYTSDTDWQI